MRVVIGEREIFEAEAADIAHCGIDLHLGKRPWFTRKLFAGLVEMISVQVQIAKGVDEFRRLQIANLRHHEREQGITGNIEWHPQKKIGAPLVELTAQASIGDVK